jgi:hypothetical protein
MADAVFDGTDVMGEFVGKGSGVAYETSNALAQRVVEALARIGFAGVRRDSFMVRRGNAPGVDRQLLLEGLYAILPLRGADMLC